MTDTPKVEVVRDENRFYQVERQSLQHAPAKSRVTVCEGANGRLEIYYRGQKLSWKEIPARPVDTKQEHEPRVQEEMPKKKWRPAPDHPWRRGPWQVGATALASASASP